MLISAPWLLIGLLADVHYSNLSFMPYLGFYCCYGERNKIFFFPQNASSENTSGFSFEEKLNPTLLVVQGKKEEKKPNSIYVGLLFQVQRYSDHEEIEK